jgi:hypothetical protein
MMVDGGPKRVGVILCIVLIVGDLMIITNRDHSVNFGFEWKFDRVAAAQDTKIDVKIISPKCWIGPLLC